MVATGMPGKGKKGKLGVVLNLRELLSVKKIFLKQFISVLLFVGYNINAQQIALTPDTLNASVLDCVDSDTAQFIISNTGGSDLNYDIRLNLETVLENLNNNVSMIIDSIPDRYDFLGGSSGFFIEDGGNDIYDDGNYLSTNLGQYIHYSDDEILTSSYLGSNGQYFTRKYNGLFVFAADINSIGYFKISGNLGANGAGNVDSATFSYNYQGKNYFGYLKRVHNTADPSVNHLIIVEDNSPTQTWSTNSNDDTHQINNLSGVGRIYYL